MKNLKETIFEKLRLTNASLNKINSAKQDVSNVKLSYRTSIIFNATTFNEKNKNGTTLLKAFNNHKNPKTLYTSNIEIYNLADKFKAAILLQWDEAIDGLRNALIKSNYFSGYNEVEDIENQLDAYIYNQYNTDNSYYPYRPVDYGLPTDINEHEAYEYYLDKYNIKH